MYLTFIIYLGFIGQEKRVKRELNVYVATSRECIASIEDNINSVLLQTTVS